MSVQFFWPFPQGNKMASVVSSITAIFKMEKKRDLLPFSSVKKIFSQQPLGDFCWPIFYYTESDGLHRWLKMVKIQLSVFATTIKYKILLVRKMGLGTWVEMVCHRQEWTGISMQWFKRNFATGSLKSHEMISEVILQALDSIISSS